MNPDQSAITSLFSSTPNPGNGAPGNPDSGRYWLESGYFLAGLRWAAWLLLAPPLIFICCLGATIAAKTRLSRP